MGTTKSQIVFSFFYNKDNSTDSKPLYINDEDALKNSNFESAKLTRFVTHRWINSRNSAACILVRDSM